MLKLSKQASALMAVQNHLDRVAHIKMFETTHEKELNELFEQIAVSAQKGSIRMFFNQNELLKNAEIQSYLSLKGFTVLHNCVEWYNPLPAKDVDLC
jgi:hypothetical protein